MNDNVAKYYLHPTPEQSVNPRLIRVYSKVINLEQIAVGDAITVEACPYKFKEEWTVFEVPISLRTVTTIDYSNASPQSRYSDTIRFEKHMCTHAENNRASPVWVRVK